MRRNDWKLSVPIRIRNSVEPIVRFLEISEIVNGRNTLSVPLAIESTLLAEE